MTNAYTESLNSLIRVINRLTLLKPCEPYRGTYKATQA
ncbi:hypothetical protein [Paenibacillus glycanilyticus]